MGLAPYLHDRYLRSLFTAGALAVIRYAKLHGTKHRPWLTALLARGPTKVAAIALANRSRERGPTGLRATPTLIASKGTFPEFALHPLWFCR
jgi:hypothetical protein